MAVIEARPPVPAWEHALRQFGARLLEATPGALTWIMLAAPAWIPIVFKLPGAIFVASAVLVFDAYWLIRSITVVAGVSGSVRHLKRDMETDWLERCRAEKAAGRFDPLQFFHLCVVPTYTEPYHVLERTVEAIVEANYPADLKMVAIITRDTDKPGWENVARLKMKFGEQV
ncbi:MAG TPA: hypothetical protein VKE27_02370, partial [Candidatus Dormibacteraeota bacterium]|nr:hypothetical protein [Candidatus Dormibacteraeota bacterium]